MFGEMKNANHNPPASSTAGYLHGIPAPQSRHRPRSTTQLKIGRLSYHRTVCPQVMQCDRERFNRFFHAMLERGVYLAPSAYEAGFVSAAHGAEEIRATLAAAREAFATLS